MAAMKTLTTVTSVLCCLVSLLAPEEPFRVVPAVLLLDFQRYDGKRIVIEGDVASGPEMTVMYLGGSPDGDDPNGMLILTSENVSRRPSPIEKRFSDMLKKKGRVHATMEGYFNGSADRQWGHQLCCRFKLRVDKVIAVR
jgi:hypothetical protein